MFVTGVTISSMHRFASRNRLIGEELGHFRAIFALRRGPARGLCGQRKSGAGGTVFSCSGSPAILGGPSR